MPRIQICVPEQQIDYVDHRINSRQKVEYSPTIQGMNRFSNSPQIKYPRNVKYRIPGLRMDLDVRNE
jgi:hypothetical protein